MKPNFDLELQFRNEKIKIIAGIDEVGRGALAGPIVAGAVVFANYDDLDSLNEINDSKKLTAKKREELDALIKKLSADYAIGVVEAEEIDKIGIGAANIVAFKRALDQLRKCDLALIDGRKFRGFEYKYYCFEKGESKSISIAAASIIAKVYRDNLMAKLGLEFSQYDFENNVGYGADKHFEGIKKHGLTKYHRRSFLSCLDKPASLF